MISVHDDKLERINQILYDLSNSVVYIIPSIDILVDLALQNEGAVFDLYNQNTKDTIANVITKISADTTYKLLNNTNLFHPRNEVDAQTIIDKINEAITALEEFEFFLERDIIDENRDLVNEYYKPDFLNNI